MTPDSRLFFINVSVWGPVHCLSSSVSILLYSISGVQNSVPEGPQSSQCCSNLVICSSQISSNLQVCRPPGTEFGCPLLHFLLFSVSNIVVFGWRSISTGCAECRRVCDFSLTANSILFFWHVLPYWDRTDQNWQEVKCGVDQERSSCQD